MDFGQAAQLAFLVYGAVEVTKKVMPASWAETMRERVTILTAFVYGIGGAFLIAESAWGNEQLVGGKPLDTLNAYSLVVVGIGLALLAAGFHKVLGKAVTAVSNIGQNVTALPTARPSTAKRAGRKAA